MDKRLKIEHMAPGHQPSIPAFLMKLRNLLDDVDNEHLIAWDESGETFHLFDQVLFAKEILPKYFKHNNLASFVRQLNMYGFKKISTVEQGSLHSKEDMEFQNPYFIRDHPELMDNIKRKGSLRDKLTTYGELKPTQVNDVLLDIKTLQSSQGNINQQLDLIKRENSALWREIAALRQKHVQQQHIINKLIQFLMTLAGTRRNLKRSLPMIEVGPSKKINITDPPMYTEKKYPTASSSSQAATSAGAGGLRSGMTIQDITDELENPVYEAEVVGLDDLPVPVEEVAELPLSPQSVLSSASAISPRSGRSPAAGLNPATPITDAQAVPNVTSPIATADNAIIPLSPAPDDFKLDFTDNIEGVQGDLDILRDLFSGEAFGISPDTVHSLFDGSNYTLPNTPEKFNLDDLINHSNQDQKAEFLKSVPHQLPNELDGLMQNVDCTDTTLEDLLDSNTNASHNKPHHPVISSHDLD